MVLTREEIKKALSRWNRAWDNHDIDGVMELFHDDVLFDNWTGGLAKGKENLRRAWGPWFSNHGGFKFTEEDTFIDEDELKTGVRREGIFMGITDCFIRFSIIASIVSISLVYTTVGWETYHPNPGADVILGNRILFVVFPGIALGITLICLYFYPLSKTKVEENKISTANYGLHAKFQC